MTRMIFSTVRAPQEPAFTVLSLAIRATGRPSMVAVPVITPSAGSPLARTFANAPSSVKLPASTSSSIRSRANILPCAAACSWYLAAPPWLTLDLTSASSGWPAGVVCVPSLTVASVPSRERVADPAARRRAADRAPSVDMQTDAEQDQRPQEDGQDRRQHQLQQGDGDVVMLPRDDDADEHPDDDQPPVSAAAENSHCFDSVPATCEPAQSVRGPRNQTCARPSPRLCWAGWATAGRFWSAARPAGPATAAAAR